MEELSYCSQGQGIEHTFAFINQSKSFGDNPIKVYIFRLVLAVKTYLILSVVSKAEINLYINMDKNWKNCNNVQNLSLTFYGKLKLYSIKTHSKLTL